MQRGGVIGGTRCEHSRGRQVAQLAALIRRRSGIAGGKCLFLILRKTTSLTSQLGHGGISRNRKDRRVVDSLRRCAIVAFFVVRNVRHRDIDEGARVDNLAVDDEREVGGRR